MIESAKMEYFQRRRYVSIIDMNQHLSTEQSCLILNDPHTCIQTLQMWLTGLPLCFPVYKCALLHFLQTNQYLRKVNIQRLTLPLLELAIAASKNPSVESLELCMGDIGVSDAAEILQSLPPDKITFIYPRLLQVTSHQELTNLATAMCNLRALQKLRMYNLQPEALFSVLSSMGQTEFPNLESLDWWSRTSSPELMRAIGSFLESKAAFALKEIQVWSIVGVTPDAMKHLTQGLSRNQSIRNLKIDFSDASAQVAEIFAEYLLTAVISELSIWDYIGRRRAGNIVDIILPALCGNESLQALSLNSQWSPGAIKNLLLHTTSLRVLTVQGWGVEANENSWMRELAEGLSLNSTLTRFKIIVHHPNDSFLDIEPIPQAVINSKRLEELCLVSDEGVTDASVDPIASMLHDPLCKLKKIEILCRLNDSLVHRLFAAAKSCSSLKSVILDTGSVGLGPETWATVAASLPDLKWSYFVIRHHVSVSVKIIDRRDKVPKTLMNALERNHCLEKVDLTGFFSRKDCAAIERICFRNKIAKLASGEIPLSLPPSVMHKIEGGFYQYDPLMPKQEVLSASLVFALLRARPEVRTAAKTYLTAPK